MLAQKRVLADLKHMNGGSPLIRGLQADIKLIDQVIERCYAQQELIDMRAEQIIGLN